jgi:hypothetical protein
MPKMIQLRRVPDDVYTVIKTQADQQGLSISDYVVRELTLRFGPPASDRPDEASSPAAPAD